MDFPLLSIIQWYQIIFPFTVLNNLFDPFYLYSLPYLTSFYPSYSVLLCMYVCICLFIYQESVHLSLNHLLLHFPEFFQFIHFFQALTCLCLYVLRVGKLFIDLAQPLQYNIFWFSNTNIHHCFQCTVKCPCSGNCEIRKEVN